MEYVYQVLAALVFMLCGGVAIVLFLLAWHILRTPKHIWEARRQKILRERAMVKDIIKAAEEKNNGKKT